jgi:SAM-dependent methyltransferase
VDVTSERVPPIDPLHPALELVLSAWAALVAADKAQVEALPDRPRPEDFYAPVAEQFRADPRRSNEPVLEHLRSLIRPEDSWLDLGAGGGRYALPIALMARRVYAVEPSSGMREVLRSGMAQFGIDNIEVIDERWPGPSACPVADVGLISHVAYDIADIGPFLDQFEAHASGLCIAVLFERAPVSEFAPLWGPVHGQDRALLPGLRELVTLLFAKGRVPEIKLFDVRRPAFESLEALHRAARRPTWVREGSDQDARLRLAVEALAVKVEGGFALSDRPRSLGVVSWHPRP